jgi:hypothetical protein
LASDDPQQVVDAASLIGALGKADAKLAVGLGARRVRYAKAVTAGIEGALSAARAVELADKRHGRPDVSDDGGTHSADAEGGGTADRDGKEKEDEAVPSPRGEVRWVDEEGGYYGVFVDGTERTGADTEEKAKALLADILARERRRGNRQTNREDGDRAGTADHGNDSEAPANADDGNDAAGPEGGVTDGTKEATDGADETNDVNSSEANVGQTVGPEVAPVEGPDDTKDTASDQEQPNMAERFAQRLYDAIEKEFHGPIGLDAEDERILRELGLFRRGDEGQFNPLATLRGIYEVLIRGGATAVGLTLRTAQALSNAIAAALAQTAEELGETKTGSRMLERDLNLLLMLAAMLAITRGPGGPRRPPGSGGKRPGETRPRAIVTPTPDSGSRPVGRSGNPIEIKPRTNKPDKILGDNGRIYSGHSLDRMQGRGIPLSVAEDTIENGQRQPGRKPGTTAHYNPDNNVTVITNTKTGKVLTVRHGRP